MHTKAMHTKAMDSAGADEVIDFWFGLDEAQWWAVDPALDALIGDRFTPTLEAVVRGETWRWRDRPVGRLAEVIVLDQFSRNAFRGTPRAFAQDPQALALAQEAVRSGHDRFLSVAQRGFLYLPFEHSESRLVHDEAVRLFSEPGLELQLDYELRHKVIIERFGRYPHRNAILGRESTAEELEFLTQPGSSF